MDSPGKNTGMGWHFLLQDIPDPGIEPRSSCIAGRFFTIWITREAHSRRWIHKMGYFVVYMNNKGRIVYDFRNNVDSKSILPVHFSSSVVSYSLWPRELQHARPPCPSPTPGIHPNSCPSSWWRHQAISFSVVPFSSCLQPLPSSGSFPMSQLFAWGGQSIGVSALASVLPKNIQDFSISNYEQTESFQRFLNGDYCKISKWRGNKIHNISNYIQHLLQQPMMEK